MYNVKNTNFTNSGIRYEKVYIASKTASKEDDFGNIIPIYKIPKMYKMNIMPLTESIDIQAFGENSNATKVAILDYNQYKDKFKDFDVAYLDGNTPKNDTVNGETANYVLMVRPQNKIIKLYFRKIVKGE